MTQKELSYVEDAVSHEKIIVSILEEDLNNIEDDNLKSFMNEEVNKHNEIKERLMNLLEEKVNE